MSDLTYQHDAIEQMAMELKSFVSQIDAQLAQTVEAEFNSLRADGFTGVASDAFGVASKAWNDLCADYQAGLTTFHGKVSTSNQDMKMTDQELAKMFDF